MKIPYEINDPYQNAYNIQHEISEWSIKKMLIDVAIESSGQNEKGELYNEKEIRKSFQYFFKKKQKSLTL
jgi:hypothetical protein